MRRCRTFALSLLILLVAFVVEVPAQGLSPQAPPRSQPSMNPSPGSPGAQAPGEPPAPGQKPGTGPQKAPPPPPPKPDPEATKLVEQAISKMDLKQLGWIETTLWQRMHFQGLEFAASGRYIVGPDFHVRLDLTVDLSDLTGSIEVVGDGKMIWEASQIGKEPRVVHRRIKLADVLAVLNRREVPAAMRTEYAENQAFAGIAPLLKALQLRVVFTKLEKNVSWKGHTDYRLTGVWNPQQVPPPAPPHSANQPQRCELYLDEKTLWPDRIEWWGEAPPQTGEVLLLEMEFRSPKFGQKPPPRTFVFKATKEDEERAEIDQTKAQIKLIKKRAGIKDPESDKASDGTSR
jgi:hypothetical protein